MRADEYPDTDYPIVEDGKYKGTIGVGGLVLARVPEEIAQQRQEYYAKQHAEKVEEVSGVREFCQHPTKSQQKTGNLGLFGALLQPPAPGKITKLGKDPIKI